MKQPFSRGANVAKPLTKFPTFYGTQIFIIVVTNHHPQPHERNLYPPTLPVKRPAEPLKAPRLQAHVQQDYIHKAPLISHDNLHLLSHKSIVAITQEDWQVHNYDCISIMTNTQATSRSVPTCDISLSLTNVTCIWSWRLREISPATPTVLATENFVFSPQTRFVFRVILWINYNKPNTQHWPLVNDKTTLRDIRNESEILRRRTAYFKLLILNAKGTYSWIYEQISMKSDLQIKRFPKCYYWTLTEWSCYYSITYACQRINPYLHVHFWQCGKKREK
jgi:hypothetical protein